MRAMSKAYSSNLTLEQWELIEPLIPPALAGGRPREVDVWDVLNAIFYLLTQGCTWRNLPGDFQHGKQCIATSARGVRMALG